MSSGRADLNFSGVFTALVTPFTPDGTAVDYDALDRLVEAQVAGGVAGVVPVGTTGECPTLTHEEHDAVIARVVAKVAKRCLVIGGTGSNSTPEAVRLTRAAKLSGVDAALVVNPYYNKPNQAGLRAHFAAVATVGLPIVLYNIPGRTNVNMSPETVQHLYDTIPAIVAIKEATGSMDQASGIGELCRIQVLSGDDSLTLPLMSVGAVGVISVASNLDPAIVKSIVDPALQGDFAAAREAHTRWFRLFRAMFCDVNPLPVKRAMKTLGKCEASVRLPLVEMAEDEHLTKTLVACGLHKP